MNSNDSAELFSNESPRSFQRSLRPQKNWHEIDELDVEEDLNFDE